VVHLNLKTRISAKFETKSTLPNIIGKYDVISLNPNMLCLKVSRSKLTDIFRKLNRFRLGKRFRDSVVGIATRYGLDGSGIKSLCGARFPHPSGTALGLTQPSIHWVPGPSRG
jgi:hypothetical protein